MEQDGESKTMREDGGLSAHRIGAVIGLGALLSTILINSASNMPFWLSEHIESFIGAFSECSLCVAAVAALGYSGVVLYGKHPSRQALLLAGGLFYLSGAALFVLFAFAGNVGAVVVAAAALLAGAGAVAMGIVWADVYRRYDLKQGLANVAGACMVAGAVYGALSLAPLSVRAALFACCAVVAVALPFALLDMKAGGGAQGGVPPASTQGRLKTLRSLAGVSAVPAIGMLFFAFAVGVMRGSFNDSYTTYTASMVVAAGILLAYALSHKRPFTMRSLSQMFLPLLAIILLTATSLTSLLGGSVHDLLFLVFLLYLFAAMLTLATLGAIAHAGEFSSDLVFGIAIALFSIASYAGLRVSQSVEEEMVAVVITVITTVYAFLMMLYSYLRWRRSDSCDDADRPDPAHAVESTAERCNRLAADHRLTARETEILGYLAEGHSGAYISDVLFISPNTARTHIHNIYRKLDVSSREDILRLVKQ